MKDLYKLTVLELLEKCPDVIIGGNWNEEWQEIRRRLIENDKEKYANWWKEPKR